MPSSDVGRRTRALALLFGFASISAIACSEPKTETCRNDDDCAMGEQCNLFVGRCLVAEASSAAPGAALHERCTGRGTCAEGECLGTEQAALCLSPCASDTDCERDDPGTHCFEFGPELAICLSPCTEKSDCDTGMICAEGGCVFPDWIMPDAETCDEAASVGSCDSHVAFNCVDGQIEATDCTQGGRLCSASGSASGAATCIADPGDVCESGCAAIHSCGFCLALEDECLTQAECVEGCRDLQPDASCRRSLDDCDLETFVDCAGLGEAGPASNDTPAADPACAATPNTGYCDQHVATQCDAGVATTTNCAAAGQLCSIGVDGRPSCVAAVGSGCGALCAQVESCGVCVEAAGECVTPANCEAQCEEQRFNTLCGAETQVCDEAALQACVDKDPLCVETPGLALCLSHATVICVGDELVFEGCGTQGQLCDGTDGAPRCVAPPSEPCELLCGLIHSCGYCTQQDGECVSVDDCVARCEESTWTTECEAAATCDEAGILECLMLTPALQ